MRITERRKRGALLGALTTTLLAASSLTLAPTIASAESAVMDDAIVAGATLDWGVKESFRRYVVGPIPKGSIELLGNTTGTYQWSGGQGTAALDGSSADVSFGVGNGVHFRGHKSGAADDAPYILDVAFTNPRIVVTSPTTGELRADVEGREFVNTTTVGDWYSNENASLAELTLPEPTIDGDVRTWSDAKAVLTKEGAENFAGFYEPGELLDPVSFSLPIATQPVAVATQTTLVASADTVPQGDILTLTATVAPEAPGTVQFTNGDSTLGEPVAVDAGTATLQTSALEVGSNSLTAEFAPESGSAFLGSVSDVFEVTVTPRDTPTVMVDKLSGIDPAGEEITVTGTGFLPKSPDTDGRYAPLAGRFTGAYVVFGSFAEQWQPSQGINSAARKGFDTRWAVQAPELALISSVPGGIELNADGTFETTLTLTKDSALALENGRYGVYTYPGGGATYAPFETFTPIEFAPAQATSVTLDASKSSVFAGDEVELAAAVSADVAGTVRFTSNGERLADSVTVADGAAALTTTDLGVGANEVVAEFVPANTDVHLQSESAAVSVTVAAFPVVQINGKPAGTVTVNPGDELELRIGAFAAGDEFEIAIQSETATLPDRYTADESGFLNANWTVPADFALGAHSITVTNTSTDRVFTFADAFVVEKATVTEPGGDGPGGDGPGGDGKNPGGGDKQTPEDNKGSNDPLAKGGSDGPAVSLAVGAGLLLLLGGALLAARRSLADRSGANGIIR